MKEVTNLQYIKINPADISEYSSNRPRSVENILRSIEHYLETNNISINLEGNSRIIYVDGKNEAIRLGQYFNAHFGVSKILYFNGEVLSALPVIVAKDTRRAPRATVVDNVSGEKVSLRKYKKDTQNEINQKYVSFSDIVSMKIMPKAKLEKLVSEGVLMEVTIGNKKYMSRVELLSFLKSKAG